MVINGKWNDDVYSNKGFSALFVKIPPTCTGGFSDKENIISASRRNPFRFEKFKLIARLYEEFNFLRVKILPFFEQLFLYYCLFFVLD